MDSARALSLGVVAAIVGTLLVAGPAIGALDLTAEEPSLGGGTATVVDVAVERPPALTEGRFGTDRTYLRGQTVTVRIRTVSDTPRLVIRSEALSLGYDDATARVLESDTLGVVRLSIPDRGFDPGDVPDEPVTVRTTVRLQSFDDDRIVLDRNDSVGGGR